MNKYNRNERSCYLNLVKQIELIRDKVVFPHIEKGSIDTVVKVLGRVVVGLILASNPIGWIVYWYLCRSTCSFSCYCGYNTRLHSSFNVGIWVNEKSAVNFDKQPAITEGSLLLCDSGGVMHAANFIKYEFTQYKLIFK